MIQDALREISLCDTESIWFYRLQEFLFFELLAKRFCQREKSIYGLLDVGKISMDPKTKRDYASNYHLDPDEILAVYKEKKRKHNII